jgi:hypothetical protein
MLYVDMLLENLCSNVFPPPTPFFWGGVGGGGVVLESRLGNLVDHVIGERLSMGHWNWLPCG